MQVMQEKLGEVSVNFYGFYSNMLNINPISCKCFGFLKILIQFYFQSTVKAIDEYMKLVVSLSLLDRASS